MLLCIIYYRFELFFPIAVDEYYCNHPNPTTSPSPPPPLLLPPGERKVYNLAPPSLAPFCLDRGGKGRNKGRRQEKLEKEGGM